MLRSRLLKIAVLFALIAVSVIPLHTSPVSASRPAAYGRSGVISSGAQYDLYTFYFAAGTQVTAQLDCASAPANTLDTVLSVFFPGSDPSSTANADVYNDDGGSLVCGGFRSSLAVFITPVAGDYTFRVDGFGSATGAYSLTASDTTGCDARLPLDGAVVGSFVADAPLYAEPGVLISPTITIPAGKTYWVSGLDASGQYYRIFLQCSVVWVPASAVGPNYDSVWNGAALPTTVIESGGK
jgi:hypothetical protein